MDESLSCHNACLICLSPLLVPPTTRSEDDDGSLSNDSDDDSAEIGAVFPCGHVYHLHCWALWSDQKRCPSCNQEATLFCKLFLSAPSIPTPTPAKTPKPAEYVSLTPDSDQEEPEQLEQKQQSDRTEVQQDPNDDEEKEQRQILLDMRTATQAGPAQTIRKVVSLRSKVRKLRREGRETQSELESTRLVLDITQEELQLANEELESQKQKVEEYRGKLARIQSQHWEKHKILHEELIQKHNKQIKSVQKDLQQVKAELALRNRQLKHWAGQNTSSEIPGVVHVSPR